MPASTKTDTPEPKNQKIPNKTNISEITMPLDRLIVLHHDPEQFAQDVQEEINALVVMSDMPICAVIRLGDEMIDRCNAMYGFNNQLQNPSST